MCSSDLSHTGSNTVLVAPVVTFLPRVTGAGAVVLRGEVPDNAVVVGVPAKALPAKISKVAAKKPAAKAGPARRSEPASAKAGRKRA